MKEYIKSVELQISQEEERVIEGYLSTYGNKDRDNDVILKGAFSESILKKPVVPFLLNHERTSVIGSMELTEDDKGVFVRGKLYDNDLANTTYRLVKDGALNEFSVGFYLEDWESDAELMEDNGDYGLLIKKASIFEGSIVYVPANPQAVVTNVKNKEENNVKENLEKISQLEEEIKELKDKEGVILKEKQEEVTLKQKEIDDLKKEVEEQEKMLKEAREHNERIKGANVMENNYMKSKSSMNDFADVILKCKDEWRDGWKEHLATKGIANAEVFFPEAVVTAVNDNMQQHGRLLPFINAMPGLTVKKVVNEILGDLGSGYNRKLEENKKTQNLDFTSKVINCQFVYKMQELEKEMLKQDTKGLLLNYILKELPERLVLTIEKAITIGDGLPAGDKYKIWSYEAITEAEEYFKTDLILDDKGLSVELLDEIEKGIATGEYVLIMNRKTRVDLKGIRSSDSSRILATPNTTYAGFSYPTIDNIITVDQEYMSNDYKSDQPVLIALGINAYTQITDKTDFDFYRDFVLRVNKEEVLVESFSGGALERKESAVVVWGSGKAPKPAPEVKK